MDGDKRKREDKGEADEGKKARARAKAKATADGDGGAKAATDVEVEEFFAIMRRMRVAIDYFKKGEGGGIKQLLALEDGWKPSPEEENPGQDKHVEGQKKREHFDLNLDPSSKGDTSI